MTDQTDIRNTMALTGKVDGAAAFESRKEQLFAEWLEYAKEEASSRTCVLSDSPATLIKKSESLLGRISGITETRFDGECLFFNEESDDHHQYFDLIMSDLLIFESCYDSKSPKTGMRVLLTMGWERMNPGPVPFNPPPRSGCILLMIAAFAWLVV